MKTKKLKVLVAMSGGVDSSVAALLMKKKGHEVVGVFMKNWSEASNAGEHVGECNWVSERRMASKIAAILGIPLITIDSEKDYRKKVIDKMFKDYKKGITPNPDVDCNQKVKFPVLIKLAKKLKADKVVTGHYARIKNGKFYRGKDETKDQSYFLYRLNKNDLNYLLFPIGDYTKKKIREIARKSKFPNHDKKSTVGICFVGKVNLKDFLKKKIKQKKGKILNPSGEVIGEHDGIYYYTIGQRLGPRYGFDLNKVGDEKQFMKKWYVARKDARKNIIVAAPEGHELNYRKEILIKNAHWISRKPKNDEKLYARIRQVGELLPCRLIKEKNKFKVTLNKKITGVSEGQAIVLYKGKEVLGGGEIRFG